MTEYSFDKAYTHAGVFHADDVCAAALLRMINPNIHIIRVNQPSDLPEDRTGLIIFDIGGGEFDHHTKESMECRPNVMCENGYIIKGAPYASFGKVLRAFYNKLMSEKVFDILDKTLAVDIDSQDALGGIPGKFHTKTPNQFSMAISSFNPQWNEEPNFAEAFEVAVTFAKAVIERYIAKAKAMVESEDVVCEAMARQELGDHFLVLSRYVNYSAYLADNIHWVIYPSLRGGYQMFSRILSGHNVDLFDEEDMAELRKDPCCTFVHPSGFTAVFTDLEDATYWAKRRSTKYDKLVAEMEAAEGEHASGIW